MCFASKIVINDRIPVPVIINKLINALLHSYPSKRLIAMEKIYYDVKIYDIL